MRCRRPRSGTARISSPGATQGSGRPRSETRTSSGRAARTSRTTPAASTSAYPRAAGTAATGTRSRVRMRVGWGGGGGARGGGGPGGGGGGREAPGPLLRVDREDGARARLESRRGAHRVGCQRLRPFHLDALQGKERRGGQDRRRQQDDHEQGEAQTRTPPAI